PAWRAPPWPCGAATLDIDDDGKSATAAASAPRQKRIGDMLPSPEEADPAAPMVHLRGAFLQSLICGSPRRRRKPLMTQGAVTGGAVTSDGLPFAYLHLMKW